MIRRIPTDWNVFTRKNKRCGVSLPISCIRPSFFRGYQTITVMNHEVIVFKYLGYSPAWKGSILPLTFDGQLPDL